MSLKQEIETWVEALAKYDNNEFEEALKTFDTISDTSKILFNCGVIHATLGEHDKAVECYQRAVRLDQYLAVSYFQQGVSNFLVGDFEEALANFNDTLLYLRGNTYIDYEQLGLKFKLYSCEALFNRGLCYIYLQQKEAGLADLNFAAKEKVTPDHNVIDEAIREEADGYTVFSIPVGIVYRPNSSKVKNLKTKDYLGKARLIASADRANTSTGFAGAEQRRPTVDTSRDDRPAENISYAASNLVRPDLTSRGSRREQSAPPINRNVFPPTPPPESEKDLPLRPAGAPRPSVASHLTARANSVREGSIGSAGAIPPPLRVNPAQPRRPTELSLSPKSSLPGHAASPWGSDSPYGGPLSADHPPARPRLGTVRTASEPRGGPSKYSTAREGRGYRGGATGDQRDIGPAGAGAGAPRRLFMETTPALAEEEGEAGGVRESDIYELYRSTASGNPYASPTASSGGGGRRHGSGGAGHSRLRSLDEAGGSSGGGLDALGEFEMLNDAGGSLSMRPRDASRGPGGGYGRPGAPRSGSVAPSSSTGGGGGGSGSDVRTVRVKARHGEDTRYLMVAATVGFDEFRGRVRDKLGVRGRFKLQTRDEGDLITVGDAEDWELALAAARKEARRADEEMARLEVWVKETA